MTREQELREDVATRDAVIADCYNKIEQQAAENARLRDALSQINALDRCLHPLCRSTQAAHIARDAVDHEQGGKK